MQTNKSKRRRGENHEPNPQLNNKELKSPFVSNSVTESEIENILNKSPQNLVKANIIHQNNLVYQDNSIHQDNLIKQNNLNQAYHNQTAYNNFIQQVPNNAVNNQNANMQKPKYAKVLKFALLLLLSINIGLVGLYLSFNAFVMSSKATKKTEHERVVNNHPLYFRSEIEQTASKYNLQPAYVSAIIKCESSFKADAQSNVGALGLMQLMPDTAEWISEKLNDSLYAFERMADPQSNMEYGCWYLNFLSKRYNGNPILTTAAYHTGQGQIANWLADKSISGDGISISIENMPNGPTKQYVRRVLNAYAVYDALYFKNNN